SELCLTAFEPFIGMPFDSSLIAITILYVSPEEWAEPAKRHISCSVADMDSNGNPVRSTGTLQGAGR
ncbi:septum formation family protein, partial [Salinibacterium sp.]|uniref:septum formation family protein n=1 Tax=Salinibacterium sp. TaxID=1915057 RepID=UPI00286C5F99